MALKYPDRIESNNPQAYGIVKATEVSGAKNAAEYGGLLSIPDKILSANGSGGDALYLLWIDDNSVYRLIDWNNRRNSKGWRLEYNYIEWGSNDHLNSFTESGQYYISGQSNGLNGGLPILNSDPGHTFDAVLRVLDSSLTKDENEKLLCITLILSLSNRMGSDGHIFVRTIQTLEKNNLTRTDIESPTCDKWGTWEKLLGIFEKNVVELPVHLNTYTTNGMYSGVFVNPDRVGDLQIKAFDTFLLITVNGYAAAGTALVAGLNKAPQLTQLLYITPIETGLANLYTRTATWNGSLWIFGKFYRIATSEDINAIRTGALYQFNIVPTKDNVKFVTSNLDDFIVGEVNMLQASATLAGVMSAEDKIKLDSVESTANDAKSAAETAQTAADTAQETANSARETATAASTAAQEAKNAAETAQATATAASAVAAAAKQTAENEATARTEADTELQSQINGKQDNIDSLSADEKNAFLVSLGLGKIGVISQKQNWKSDYSSYTVSDVVKGIIPQYIIDNWISLSSENKYDGIIYFRFNEDTGYFECNDLLDITFNDAILIMKYGDLGSYAKLANEGKRVRVLFSAYLGAQFANNNMTYVGGGVFTERIFCHGIVSITRCFCPKFDGYDMISLIKCKEILYLNLSTITKFHTFRRYYALTTFFGIKLAASATFQDSPFLSNESILFLIEHEKSSSSITITLHASAYARAMADESILAALEAHTNISLASA